MILKMYTDSLLNELKTNVKNNLEKYKLLEPFVKDIPNYDVSLYNLEKEVTYPKLNYDNQNIPQWEADFNNAVLLHKEFVLKYQIPISVLSDERFIAYLTHDVYHEYMFYRWSFKNEKRIKEKYFLVSQPFTRNTFLRYFWYTYISYDASLDNPYELTKIAFKNQDAVNQIMERKYSRNKKIIIPALKAMKDSPDIPNDKRGLFGKYLNNVLSLYALDLYKEADLIDLCKKAIKDIVDIDYEEEIEEDE